MDIEFRPSSFTPADAERITGINTAQQRNLRRHGYLPETGKGWTRFSPEELARLLVLGRLAAIGVPPSTADGVLRQAKNAALVTLAFAQREPGAIENPMLLEVREVPLKHAADLLTDNRFLVFDGTAHLEATSPPLDGALVIDLHALGALLCKRAGPLFSVRQVG